MRRVTYESVLAMVTVLKYICEDTMPVMHIFESIKVVVISPTSGVLVRPINIDLHETTFKFEHSVALKFLNMSSPRVWASLTTSSASCSWVSPSTSEPKENLGMQMELQGLGLDPVKDDTTIISLGETRPVVPTQDMNVLMNNSTVDNLSELQTRTRSWPSSTASAIPRMWSQP